MSTIARQQPMGRGPGPGLGVYKDEPAPVGDPVSIEFTATTAIHLQHTSSSHLLLHHSLSPGSFFQANLASCLRPCSVSLSTGAWLPKVHERLLMP